MPPYANMSQSLGHSHEQTNKALHSQSSVLPRGDTDNTGSRKEYVRLKWPSEGKFRGRGSVGVEVNTVNMSPRR